jgi:hypothetical protein
MDYASLMHFHPSMTRQELAFRMASPQTMTRYTRPDFAQMHLNPAAQMSMSHLSETTQASSVKVPGQVAQDHTDDLKTYRELRSRGVRDLSVEEYNKYCSLVQKLLALKLI